MEGDEIVDTRFAIVRSPLLDMNGVATWLGTSHRHVRRMVAERRIPIVKVGRFVRFDEHEVEHWIDDQRVAPARSVSSLRRGR